MRHGLRNRSSSPKQRGDRLLFTQNMEYSLCGGLFFALRNNGRRSVSCSIALFFAHEANHNSGTTLLPHVSPLQNHAGVESPGTTWGAARLLCPGCPGGCALGLRSFHSWNKTLLRQLGAIPWAVPAATSQEPSRGVSSAQFLGLLTLADPVHLPTCYCLTSRTKTLGARASPALVTVCRYFCVFVVSTFCDT